MKRSEQPSTLFPDVGVLGALLGVAVVSVPGLNFIQGDSRSLKIYSCLSALTANA